MQRSLRLAGWGTLGFAIAFFVTFSINAVVNTLANYPDLPLASDMASDFLGGVVFVLTWSTAGSALVVAVVGLSGAVWASDALGARVATAFGTIAAAGWLLSGAAGLAQRTALLNGNITAAHADLAAERALIEGLYVVVHAGGILFAVAALPWLAIVAIAAARNRSISRVAIVCLWIAGIGPIAGFLASGLQIGILAVVPAFAVVGVTLLRRARRAGGAAVEAETATPTGTVARA